MSDIHTFYTLALLVVFPATVIYAGASDLVSMTISNRLTIGLTAAFAVLAIWSGMPLALLGNHIMAGALALIICFTMFAFGWIGGGDAKLCAATALWVGFDLLAEFALISTVFGGVLTLGLLYFRKTPISQTLLKIDWLAHLHYPKTGIPYGIALSAAGLTLYSRSFWLNAALG